MKAEKAKDLLQQNSEDPGSVSELALSEAEALGVEALSFIILARVSNPGSLPTLLHGETEE